MFSGIIEAIGTIRSVEYRETTRRFRVEVPAFASELCLGDSVSVDGGCLTVTSVDDESFSRRRDRHDPRADDHWQL